MTKNIRLTFLLFALSVNAFGKGNVGIWKPNTATKGSLLTDHINNYVAYRAEVGSIKNELQQAAVANKIITLPTPDGGYRNFEVHESQMMEAGLAAKYPNIKTYAAIAVDDRAVIAKLDITEFGFHAMVFEGARTYMVEPATQNNSNEYLCYFKRDYKHNDNRDACSVMASEDELLNGSLEVRKDEDGDTPLKVHGTIRRSYRLALGATAQYSAAVAPSNLTKAAVLSAMVTTMNRVNGVFEKEIGVTMVLVNNTDDLIYLAEEDGYTNGSGTTMLTEHQNKCNTIILSSNYDIGHVFSTGGGGVATLGCVCNSTSKAKGVTGQPNPVGDPFDIDYVAHEMGHQFGARHTFNAHFNAGSCTGNAFASSAYEPGGGSTIMAYAGICGAANHVQDRSDDYFHAHSLDQISDFLAGSGGGCATTIASGNIPPVVPSFNQTYFIPYKTPFELTAPDAVDADHDALTYCWEQYNLGDFGENIANTITDGPIFRSFKPTTSLTRVFPRIDSIINNVNAYQGEKLPEVGRVMTFRLTVRDVLNGFGTFNFSDDEVFVIAQDDAGPFKVMAPNVSTEYWQIGSNVTVTWDVANTTASPVSCSAVDIYLSVDNGYTYPFLLTTNTPNDGSETITVPFAPTHTARVKVKGNGNVFFDISNESFKINTWPAGVSTVATSGDIDIYPIPATDALNIYIHNDEPHSLAIVNTLGQGVLNTEVTRGIELDVSAWAKGVYHLQMINNTSKQRTIRKFVVD